MDVQPDHTQSEADVSVLSANIKAKHPPPLNDTSSSPPGSTTRVPSGKRPMATAQTTPRIYIDPDFNSAKQLALIIAAV